MIKYPCKGCYVKVVIRVFNNHQCPFCCHLLTAIRQSPKDNVSLLLKMSSMKRLYRNILLSEDSAGSSCTVFTPFISVNFCFCLIVKLISSYSGFWMFLHHGEKNTAFSCDSRVGPFLTFLSMGPHTKQRLKSECQHKLWNNRSKTTYHNASSMAGESD